MRATIISIYNLETRPISQSITSQMATPNVPNSNGAQREGAPEGGRAIY